MQRNSEVFDAIYWSSALFSRQAMAQNHVRPHKFVQRRALGLYRLAACLIMFSLLVFLTLYETMRGKARFYLTFAWWVCLFTWAFFAMANTHYKAYFAANEKAAYGETLGQDAGHPFCDWKLITHFNCFCLQASIHLTVLTVFQDTDSQQFDLVVPLISFAPLLLLTIDWLINRLYFPMTANAIYCALVYTLAVPARWLRSDVQLFLGVSLPELDFFTSEKVPELSRTTLWLLPVFIMVSTYLLNRLKFWYLDEGDLRFNPDAWAKYQNDRMDWIENDGTQDEENYFQFVSPVLENNDLKGDKSKSGGNYLPTKQQQPASQPHGTPSNKRAEKRANLLNYYNKVPSKSILKADGMSHSYN